MSVEKMVWNHLSLLYDVEVAGIPPDGRQGRHTIPMFLDYILVDSCSEEIQDAFARALVKWLELNKEIL